jgi:chorismate dehydratase
MQLRLIQFAFSGMADYNNRFDRIQGQDRMTQTGTIRVAAIADLNAAPLTHALRKGPRPPWLEVSFRSAAACADALRDGEADAALLSVVEYQRLPGLVALPGMAIATPAGVRSVRLACRGELESVRRIGLTRRSRTSVALLQVLLGHHLGIEAEYAPFDSRADAWQVNDAVLVIGDEAMTADLPGSRNVDLAGLWRKFTGLPFVFAFWAARREADVAALPTVLLASRDAGLASLAEIAREHGPRLGWSEAAIRDYFEHDLAYTLGEPELEALRRFYALCAERGLIAAARELEFARVDHHILQG